MRKKSLNPKATENRRESSRNAARTRRCVEGQIFHEMLSVLPFGNGGASGSANGPGPNALHIDKISVIRISLAYIKLRQILRYHFRNNEANGELWPERGDHDPDKLLSKNCKQHDADAIASPLSTLKLDPYGLIGSMPKWPTLVRDGLKALDCFFVVISAKGNLLYLSDNVEYYLGIPKTCLVGHRFLDFVHPCDQREVNEALTAAALSHDAATQPPPHETSTKTGLKIKGAKPQENSRPRPQMSHLSNPHGLANEGDEIEPNTLPPQQAQPSNVAAIDMIVRLKSLSTLASACTFEPPQHNARFDGPVSPSCLSPDPDTYPVERGTETDHSVPDPTHQTHHQLRLNINFLQQQPNHKVMHLYGHAISKMAPRRASAPGELALCQTTQPLYEPHVKAHTKPVHNRAKNRLLADSLQPRGRAEDELSFYIFLVASPVCGTLFDKVTSRCADKVNRNSRPLSPAPPAPPAVGKVEKPLSFSGHNAIVSRHQMDMKILFFDEIVTDVLGYEIWQMIGRSFYDFIHVLDLDTFRKNVESLHQKGQIETGMYRLLVNNGGYTWVSTQASLVSYPSDAASTAFRLADPRCDKQLSHHNNPKSDCVKQVVCLHKIVSSKEGQGHILAELQKQQNQSHLWKGISLRTEQILFKNLPGSAPPLINPIPNSLTKSSSRSINNNDKSKFQANFGSGGLASESLLGAALYDGPVLALNLSQARVLKRNHGESQPLGPVNNNYALANMGKVILETDCPALDLYKRAPCLAHEYLNPHTFTKAALKDSFNIHSLQPTTTSHKRRKNMTSVPEPMSLQTTKNGLKQSIERKNWATDQNCIQIKPRVILPKMAVSQRPSDVAVCPPVKGMIKNSDEDFFTRAPLAGDSCISVDSSILLSPMGLKRKEITKLVDVGDRGVSKPLCLDTVADVTQKVPYGTPTIALNGDRDDNVTDDFDLGQPLDRTDSMENILDDIMSLQEDKGILSFGSNETVGHGQEGEVEEIKRALLDNGRDIKAQIVLNDQSLKDRSRVASIGMESKNSLILPSKTRNPDIMICPSTTPVHGVNGQFTRHLIAPSHILNSVCSTFSTTHGRPLGPTALLATSQNLYHNLLPTLNFTRATTVGLENKISSLKKRTDTKSVPTRLANGVLANLLRNGEDLSHGYKCFSPYSNTNTTTKLEADDLPSHLDTRSISSSRRNSEPVTTTDRLINRVINLKPSSTVDVKRESVSPNSSSSPSAGFDFGSSSTLLKSEHASGLYQKSADFARFGDKMTNGYSDPKYTSELMVGHKPNAIMYGTFEPAPEDDYLGGFTPDNGEDRALLGDHPYVLEEGIEDNRHLYKGLRCYLSNNHDFEDSFEQNVGAAKFLKGLWALPGATTGLLNNGYDCNDELYNLNNGGMNVFEETNILDDV